MAKARTHSSAAVVRSVLAALLSVLHKKDELCRMPGIYDERVYIVLLVCEYDHSL